MKTIKFLSLSLLFTLLIGVTRPVCSSPATVSSLQQSYVPTTGCWCYGTGSFVYLLNQNLTGTASSPVSISSNVGVMLEVTCTGGCGQIDFYEGLTPTGGIGSGGAMLRVMSVSQPGIYPMPWKGNWLEAVVSANNAPSNLVSAWFEPVTDSTASGGF